MNRGNYETSWWERTEDYGPWRGNVKSPIYRNLTTGELKESRDLPVGALWAETDPVYTKGADGLAIICQMPEGHTWYIDSRASNCTMKTDSVHRCWVRHGTVGDKLTVDKVGASCKAGGGSIDVKDVWHGFLKAGRLVSC